MAEINVRSDSVDVEQIMRQIRARIREKRGADYTEAELQQLASVKLEKFLDPRGLRSDLVEQFRKHRTVSAEPPKYEFEDTTLYETHRGALRFMRRLLHPILKLFINPNPLIHAMHVQAQVNEEFHKRFRAREEMDPLYYEVIHNLVLETTRLGIEVHNLKMRVESLSSRLDFDERRARSLEGVVEYRSPRAPARPSGPSGASTSAGRGAQPAPVAAGGGAAVAAPATTPGAAPDAGTSGAGQGARPDGERRKRRRRRRRRPGQTLADSSAQHPSAADPDARAESMGSAPGGGNDDEVDGPDDGPEDPDDGATDQ